MSGRVKQPLRGVGVVVTRALDAGQRLCAEIARLGGNALAFPALAIAGLEPDAPLRRRLSAARSYDYWIFVSQHAVEHGVRLLRESGVSFAGATAVAVGPATQRALQAAGFDRVLVSEAGFDSEATLALPQLREARGSALIFRGRGGRETLRETLTARGMRVDYIECYERHAPAADPAPLLAAWRVGKVHAVSVMSVQTLENFLALIGAQGRERMRTTTLFVPHERVAAAARARALTRIAVTGVGDAALLDALVVHYAEQR